MLWRMDLEWGEGMWNSRGRKTGKKHVKSVLVRRWLRLNFSRQLINAHYLSTQNPESFWHQFHFLLRANLWQLIINWRKTFAWQHLGSTMRFQSLKPWYLELSGQCDPVRCFLLYKERYDIKNWELSKKTCCKHANQQGHWSTPSWFWFVGI